MPIKSSYFFLQILVVSSVAFFLASCVGIEQRGLESHKPPRELTKRELSRKLQRMHQKNENLRERNQVLKLRLKMIAREGSVTPIRSESPTPDELRDRALSQERRLEGFQSNAIVEPQAAKIQVSAAPMAKKLPAKRPMKPAQSGQLSEVSMETADRALSRTVIERINASDISNARRALGILEKSYPKSEMLKRVRLKMGLFLIAQAKKEKRAEVEMDLLKEAKSNFNSLIENFPKTREAKLAKNKITVIDRRAL